MLHRLVIVQRDLRHLRPGARDPRLERDVALKVTHGIGPGFENEARAAAALNHPNIVTVYDVGPEYVVMELVEGESLREILRRGPLAFQDYTDWGAQIAEALAAAHAARVVHRDLKPENMKVRIVELMRLTLGDWRGPYQAWCAVHMMLDSRLDPLRLDTRFRQLLARMRLS